MAAAMPNSIATASHVLYVADAEIVGGSLSVPSAKVVAARPASNCTPSIKNDVDMTAVAGVVTYSLKYSVVGLVLQVRE